MLPSASAFCSAAAACAGRAGFHPRVLYGAPRGYRAYRVHRGVLGAWGSEFRVLGFVLRVWDVFAESLLRFGVVFPPSPRPG